MMAAASLQLRSSGVGRGGRLSQLPGYLADSVVTDTAGIPALRAPADAAQLTGALTPVPQNARYGSPTAQQEWRGPTWQQQQQTPGSAAGAHLLSRLQAADRPVQQPPELQIQHPTSQQAQQVQQQLFHQQQQQEQFQLPQPQQDQQLQQQLQQPQQLGRSPQQPAAAVQDSLNAPISAWEQQFQQMQLAMQDICEQNRQLMQQVQVLLHGTQLHGPALDSSRVTAAAAAGAPIAGLAAAAAASAAAATSAAAAVDTHASQLAAAEARAVGPVAAAASSAAAAAGFASAASSSAAAPGTYASQLAAEEHMRAQLEALLPGFSTANVGRVQPQVQAASRQTLQQQRTLQQQAAPQQAMSAGRTLPAGEQRGFLGLGGGPGWGQPDPSQLQSVWQAIDSLGQAAPTSFYGVPGAPRPHAVFTSQSFANHRQPPFQEAQIVFAHGMGPGYGAAYRLAGDKTLKAEPAQLAKIMPDPDTMRQALFACLRYMASCGYVTLDTLPMWHTHVCAWNALIPLFQGKGNWGGFLAAQHQAFLAMYDRGLAPDADSGRVDIALLYPYLGWEPCPASSIGGSSSNNSSGGARDDGRQRDNSHGD